MFVKYSQGFIMMPGALAPWMSFWGSHLIQTGKFKQSPMILVVKSYWGGLINWLRKQWEKQSTISILKIWTWYTFFDTIDEVVDFMLDYYKSKPLAPNFWWNWLIIAQSCTPKFYIAAGWNPAEVEDLHLKIIRMHKCWAAMYRENCLKW